MIKILYAEIFWAKYFSVDSENDDTNSSCSPNSSNIVFYIFPALYGFSEHFHKYHLILQTPYYL